MFIDGDGLQALQGFRARFRIGEPGAFHNLMTGDRGDPRPLAVMQRGDMEVDSQAF